MTRTVRFAVIGAAVVAVLGVLAAKARVRAPAAQASDTSSSAQPGSNAALHARAAPRLVDLGAGSCIPCKAMAPILAQLRADFADRLTVEFIDVWKNPAAGEPYAIRGIPTQIFFAADGRELFRHEGFYSREEILARWQSLGDRLEAGEQ